MFKALKLVIHLLLIVTLPRCFEVDQTDVAIWRYQKVVLVQIPVVDPLLTQFLYRRLTCFQIFNASVSAGHLPQRGAIHPPFFREVAQKLRPCFPTRDTKTDFGLDVIIFGSHGKCANLVIIGDPAETAADKQVASYTLNIIMRPSKSERQSTWTGCHACRIPVKALRVVQAKCGPGVVAV